MSSGKTKKPAKNSLAQRLINWRKAKDLTQKEAAELLKESHRTYESWESDRWKPRLEVAMKILARIEKDGF